MAYQPDSLAAQALGQIDETTQALVLPIHPATTYQRDADNQYRSGNVYSRADNPTYAPAEQLLCELEQGEQALLFSSGMAAAVAVFQSLEPGDHVIAPQVMYWSLRNWLLEEAQRWGLKVTLVDAADSNAVAQAMTSETRLVWLETPANPMWSISDIQAIAQLTKANNALLAVDSTVATPVFSQPLTLGADIVMHSATKYLNGHSDVICGALVCKQADAPRWQRIRQLRAQQGAVLGHQEAYLLLRGMRTLYLRVKAAANSAAQLAEQLESHPAISQVLYPGLASFPGHEIAARQMSGFGAMLSIRLAGGEQAAIDCAARCKLFKRATSLGGVESLIEHRASIEGPGTPVPADLLRISVGIEAVEDLLADLQQALT